MRLVPPDELTEEDQEIRGLLLTHPLLAHRLTLLVNGYRELLQMCMETMHKAALDTADATISCAKKDMALNRYGIQILEHVHDWETVRKQLHAVYKERDGEEKE